MANGHVTIGLLGDLNIFSIESASYSVCFAYVSCTFPGGECYVTDEKCLSHTATYPT
jgi:hypothetical protein